MISLDSVDMLYAVPKRYREYLRNPFAGPKRAIGLLDVDLRIDVGERVAVLGPNGSGKTTLIKLIAGLLLPTRGSVCVNGHDTLHANSRAKRSVGLVSSDERSFYWPLTGFQNLEFFGALNDLAGKGLERRIHELLELVGLQDDAHKAVAAYSAGMKQRLAIARGLLADPDIVLLDEPTRGLDPVGAEQLFELIRKRLEPVGAKTLVLATNRLEEVPELCNRVCVIAGHHVVSDEPLDPMLERRSLSEHYRSCLTGSRG